MLEGQGYALAFQCIDADELSLVQQAVLILERFAMHDFHDDSEELRVVAVRELHRIGPRATSARIPRHSDSIDSMKALAAAGVGFSYGLWTY